MYRYQLLVSLVHEWVASGVMKPGERVLSVREMSAKLGYSAVTVHHAYCVLEEEGILESRPRSGFFISEEARPLPEFTAAGAADVSVEESDGPGLDSYLAMAANGSELESFGTLALSRDLLPSAELYRTFLANVRWEATHLNRAPWQGAPELREAVGKRPGVLASGMNIKDIIITQDLGEAVGLCLDLLAKPGDRVLIETPTDPTTVEVALRKGLEITEIYSHPRFGADPDQFAYLLEHNRFAACLLSTNVHVPTGVSYSADATQRIVEAAMKHSVFVIDNMARLDLSFGASTGAMLSQFDEHNLVLRMGGFAETLGPLFGVGWVALPRRHLASRSRQYLSHSAMAGDLARQRTVAELLTRRTHERHLRKIREQLSARVRKGLSMLFQHFPENCTVSRPLGGYFCWIRGPKDFSAVSGARRAFAEGISFAPGPLFSVTRSFGNFLGLNLSHQWTAERESQIHWIGELLSRAGEAPTKDRALH